MTGYYRKFVQAYDNIVAPAYDNIVAPLNQMIKKGEFEWTKESREAFEQLKNALMSPPMLAMRDFEEDFVLKCDASKVGIGAVLMQRGHPLAYIGQGLKG